MLIQIVYLSKSTKPFSEVQVAALGRLFAANNRMHQVTGVLHYESGHFVQCIEGDDQAVVKLYAKILRDPRHYDVRTVVIRRIERRTFSDWNMGVVGRLDQELDLENALPLAEAGSQRWNEAGWDEILKSFRVATLLDPFPED